MVTNLTGFWLAGLFCLMVVSLGAFFQEPEHPKSYNPLAGKWLVGLGLVSYTLIMFAMFFVSNEKQSLAFLELGLLMGIAFPGLVYYPEGIELHDQVRVFIAKWAMIGGTGCFLLFFFVGAMTGMLA